MKKIAAILSIMLVGTSLWAQDFDAKVSINTIDDMGNPRIQEEVIFTDKATGASTSCVTDENGQCQMTVAQGVDYSIAYSTWNDAQEYADYSIPVFDGPLNLTVNITVQAEPEVLTLDHVYFDTGTYILKDESFQELDKLYHYLSTKKHLNVEIGGHTDSDGSDDSNLTLSQNRANAVKDYLINKGIDANRLTAVGYGETQPRATNDTEDGRAQNRRTEVKILH